MDFKYSEFFKYIEAEQSAASDQTVQDNGNNGVVNSVAPTNDTKEDRIALITKYVDNYFNKSNNGKTGDVVLDSGDGGAVSSSAQETIDIDFSTYFN